MTITLNDLGGDGRRFQVQLGTGDLFHSRVYIGVRSHSAGNFSHTDGVSGSAEAEACEYFEVDRIPRNMPPKQVERICDALRADTGLVFRRQTAPSAKEYLHSL